MATLLSPRQCSPTTIKKGERVSLIYPSSVTGEPKIRDGVVETVKDGFVVVKQDNDEGYRTFKFARMVGPLTIHND